MDYINIQNTSELAGCVRISGAKNAALPLLAMSILAKNEMRIENMPIVADIKTFLKLIGLLGGEFRSQEGTFFVDTKNILSKPATYDIVKTMRASILVLGPLLARFKECKVSLPGGCAIGQRPVDLHLKALEAMGANIIIEGGYIHAKAPQGLKGASIIFDKITVTGTENIILAAALARGKTRLINCAKEPEVVQVCETLIKAGVEISGLGTSELEIIGTNAQLLDLPTTRVIPDRIEAGTYLCAGAITNSEIKLENIEPTHMEFINKKLLEMGYSLEFTNSSVKLLKAKEILPVELVTAEYPGFPTDMQAQFMALATQAKGTSIIEERLFENRFMHVSELLRMGAKISLNGNIASITGNTTLEGTEVMATDLRASSALVLAGLIAKGSTQVHRIYHLDRGYANLEQKLRELGAKIERKSQEK